MTVQFIFETLYHIGQFDVAVMYFVIIFLNAFEFAL